MVYRTSNARRISVLTLGFVGLATGNALAANYDWQANPGYSGTFNSATNWNAGAGVGASGAPGITDFVSFNNAQSPAYTVGFNADIQTDWYTISTDEVIYDMGGFTWTAARNSLSFYSPGAGPVIAPPDNTATLTFSSSAAGTNMVRNSVSAADFTYTLLQIAPGAPTTGTGGPGDPFVAHPSFATVNIDLSLGNAVTFWHRGPIAIGQGYYGSLATVNVDGAGSTFKSDYGTTTINGGATVNVTNGGLFDLSGAILYTAFSPDDAHINVNTGGTFKSGSDWYSVYDPTYIDIQSGGTWTALDVTAGGYRFYSGDPVYMNISVDGATSSYSARNFGVGYATDIGTNNNGEIVLKNGGTMNVSQTLTLHTRFANAAAYAKNTITLDAGTLRLGDALNAGTLVARGVVRGNGTIAQGAGNTATMTLTIDTGGELRPGDTTATPAFGDMVITNGNLTVAAGGLAAMDFGLNGLALDNDTVTLTGGVVTLSGDLVYNILGGYTPHATGSVEYFDFVTAPSIVYAAASDNMNALMAGFGLGAGDYFYGIRSIGGNDVLRLEVPEPASLALLAAGGVLLLRRRNAVR